MLLLERCQLHPPYTISAIADALSERRIMNNELLHIPVQHWHIVYLKSGHLAYHTCHVSSGIWPIWHITLACVILHVTGMSQFCSSGKTGVRGRHVALENTNPITCHLIFLSYSTMSSDLIMILSYEMSHLFL